MKTKTLLTICNLSDGGKIRCIDPVTRGRLTLLGLLMTLSYYVKGATIGTFLG